MFLVAIETEQGHAFSVSTAAAFAECLAQRFGAKGSTVLARRRSMMMIFREWAALLPWASVPSFGDGRNLWTVAKMSAIVRCIGDVLQFQHELRNRKGVEPEEEPSPVPIVVVDGEEGSSGPHSPASPTTTTTITAEKTKTPSAVWLTSLKGRKRPRGSDSAQRVIAMLLRPASANTLPHLDPADDPADVQERLSRIELQVLYGADQQRQYQPLTRLQALALQRGGIEKISDEELFEPGELEGYQNAEEDAILLAASHPEWDIAEAPGDRTGTGARSKHKGKERAKRSKADMVPAQVRYSDDEESEGSMVDGGEADLARHAPLRTGEDEDGTFPLEKDACLAFGIIPGWEGDDSDTVRYFGENMEEA